MLDIVKTKLSLIPKELIPTFSVGIIVIAVFLVVIFFALCVVYINTRPPTIIKKADKKTDDKKNNNPITKMRHEDLPIISGRLGEILTINGILKAGPITKIFFQVLEAIKNSTYDVRWRYSLPCFMMVGPENSGKTTILNSLTFEDLKSDEAPFDSMWKLFKNGAIFEMPHADSSEKETTFWSFISELFVFIRPRRPLDGIIITIPADMLLSSSIDIEKISQEIFDKVFAFQSAINFRIPIYLIVTKSDLIQGFSEFSHLLSDKSQQQIFGWSNPNSLSSAFSTSWIGEIFETINSGIKKAVILFSRDKNISGDLEKAVLFETHFNKIQESLSKYLMTMFKVHNPADGLLLRGVYFIGRHKKVEISKELLQVSALNPDFFTNNNVLGRSSYNDDLCFLQDLFGDKIFKESNLAYPIRHDAIDMAKNVYRNKAIFAIGSVAVSLGWFYGNHNLKNKINDCYQTFSSLKTMMMKLKNMEDHLKSDEDQILLNKQTSNLLQNMPVVKRLDMVSVFVPQSWFSSLREEIMDTIGLVFDSVVVRAMYIDLNVNTKNVLTGIYDKDDDDGYEDQKDLFDINAYESFKKLKHFTKQISSIKKSSSEYNSIRKLEDRKSVIDLTDTIFKDKFEIVEEMKTRSPNKKLLPPQFDLKLFQERIELNLSRVFSDFMNEVFSGTMEKILQNIVDDINKLDSASKEAILEYSAKDLARIYQKTVLFTDILKNKNFAWVSEKNFSPTNDYAEIINSLNVSELVSRNCLKELLRSAEVEFHKFKNKLRGYKTILTDELFSNDLKKASLGFESFLKELKTILDLPFICTPPSTSFTTVILDDKMLLWDIKRLKELSDLIDKYYLFSSSMPKDMRAQYFEMYKAISRKCFYPTAQSMLGNAQIFDDMPLGHSRDLLEDAYKRQSDNVRNAAVSITKVVKFFDEIFAEDSLKDCGFASMIVSHYIGLLEKIDAIFNLETPYSSGGEVFDGWRGDSDPKFLNIDEQDALKKYLSRQFSRIRFLAKDLASPVVDLLSMPHVLEKVKNKALLDKWSEIISSVNDYEAKKPGNSIAALEDFLSGTLKKVSIDSFDQHGEIKTISETGGDYFVAKRSDVAKALMSRAEIVQYDKAAASYNKIETFFNEQLSHKFPFGNSEDDASVADIEEFIEIYDQNSSNLLSILERNKDRKQIDKKVFDFLNSVNKIMPLLKAWIAHSKNSDPKDAVASFGISMRPSPDSEALTSSVLERVVKVKEVDIPDNGTAVFYNGDAVNVVFGWVEQSDEKPYAKDLSKDLTVEGSNATFSYGGKWAMFRLIESRKTNKEIEYPNGVLLQFDVPIIDSSKGNSLMTSKMILKITPMIKTGDKLVPIAWPIFPDSCPDLHGNKPIVDQNPQKDIPEINSIKAGGNQ